jgi:molybdate transport system permease protein
VNGREAGLRVLGAAGAGIAIAFLVLPVAAILLRTGPATLAGRLGEPLVLAALRLSLVTSAASTVLVVALGLPVALLLAMHSFPGKRLVETLVALPMVLPPTVAGLGLLLAFGRSGILGGAFEALGFTIPFTTLAVVLAQAFVAMPFFITTAVAGFREVDPAYLDAAATLRAGPVHRALRVLVPLSLPSLMAGAAMGWARALGEFGATITFAGNLPGRTQTMPLAVYLSLETDLESAVALAVLLLAVSFAVLFAARGWTAGLTRRSDAQGERR